MILFPAIDLFDGKVVRLTRGDYQQQTVYSSTPSVFAKKWQDDGAEWLHIVDLNGARDGVMRNLAAVREIKKATTCKLQFGGGIRNQESAEAAIGEGVDRIIIGTKALDSDFLGKMLAQFGSQIAVGLDCRNNRVQTEGWLQSKGITLFGMLEVLNNFPLETIIYTDILKDGMLKGPNVTELARVLERSKSRIILSGGISTLADILDIRKIRAENFEGAIIGKALYEGALDLKQALAVIQSRRS
ncbi:MAG: 1-(5-phosphoribosyl)-5-[(5-phosphoribosylamino)methylideneamino]imidazole-4-carboxamide isomerase [Omnitrophica bacterium GWA2_52_8]|nr:MAG: 1-(5-phosphoribosyl)-5-[(5-phosphoribosylamino)methylideneamino]imidazole-4-carboxamide isomerase [Omnitrophica bacterium GWA2_52_8]